MTSPSCWEGRAELGRENQHAAPSEDARGANNQLRCMNATNFQHVGPAEVHISNL
jgi:hypothetical protein